MAFRQAPSRAKRSVVIMILIPADYGNATLALYVRCDNKAEIAWRATMACRHTANRIPRNWEKPVSTFGGKARQSFERFV
jgi:hypothetical protein